MHLHSTRKEFWPEFISRANLAPLTPEVEATEWLVYWDSDLGERPDYDYNDDGFGPQKVYRLNGNNGCIVSTQIVLEEPFPGDDAAYGWHLRAREAENDYRSSWAPNLYKPDEDETPYKYERNAKRYADKAAVKYLTEFAFAKEETLHEMERAITSKALLRSS